MTKLRSYHFSLGNSTDGPIGFCARIVAESKEAAVRRLFERLPLERDISCEVWPAMDQHEEEYVAVYLNPAAIQVSDIDEDDEHEECGLIGCGEDEQ